MCCVFSALRVLCMQLCSELMNKQMVMHVSIYTCMHAHGQTCVEQCERCTDLVDMIDWIEVIG